MQPGPAVRSNAPRAQSACRVHHGHVARNEQAVSYLGRTKFRGSGARFGMRQTDRLSHLYVVGKTGVGKSTLLATLALQDIREGRGIALIDPHGDLAARIYRSVPAGELHRVTYLDATDLAQPFGYNPLRRVREDKIPLA